MARLRSAIGDGRRRQMREQGFTDGVSGRAARWPDADYQASWRRGREQAEREQAKRDGEYEQLLSRNVPAPWEVGRP